MLVLMVGLSGTGKSRLAQQIGRTLPAVVIDKDVVKSALLATGELDWKRSGWLSYAVLPTLARSFLDQGFNVVIDSPGSFVDFQEQVRLAAEQAQTELKVIECICSDEATWERRFSERARNGKMPSQLSGLEDMKKELSDQIFQPIGLPGLRLDTCTDDRGLLQAAMDYLSPSKEKAPLARLEPTMVRE